MPASLDNIDCESVNSTVSSPPSPGSPISPTHSLHRLDRKSSVRPYQSKDAYLYAMKEDLAVWFNDLYNTNLTADNLLDNLQDGTFLCLHANNVKSYIDAAGSQANVPNIIYRTAGVKPGSFQARDNLANFINWVKNHLAVNDVLLFESDDLVLMKNQKNVVLCLLEVARRGARYGMLAPMLVQFEQEIDALELKIKRAEGRRSSQGSINNDSSTAANSDTESDRASLDEWVQSVVHRCTCPKQFPLIHVSRGKYRIGYTQNVVFVRILRNHVMIRVGGGWDTLEHYLDKHDPCRCYRSGGMRQRARHRTSTAKDQTTLNREKSPLAGNRTRSQSFTSLEISESQPLSAKPRKSGSADLLNGDLVITRDDTGRHVIDESLSPTEPGAPTSPQPMNPSNNNRLNPSSHKRNQRQGSLKSRNNSLSVSPGRALVGRSSSPSQDLIKKWKDGFRSGSIGSSSSSRDRSNSRPRKSSTNQLSEKLRNRSITHLSQRNRSHSRTRHSSSPDKQEVRSRSCSRLESTSNFDTLKRRGSLRASPRKDKRHSHSTLPTRIPLPVTKAITSRPTGTSSTTNQTASSSMVSSTSTCNSSMDIII